MKRLGTIIIGILFLTLLMLLTSCSTKTHVITEWDGNRQINWYTTDKQKGYESKGTD